MLIGLAGIIIFTMICTFGTPANLSTRVMAGKSSETLVLDVQATGAGSSLIQRFNTSPGLLPPGADAEKGLLTGPGGGTTLALMPPPDEPAPLAIDAPHPHMPLLAESLTACELPPQSADESGAGVGKPAGGIEMALRRPASGTTQLPAQSIGFIGLHGKAGEAVAFEDGPVATTVCHELAEQLHNLNHDAAQAGRPPYRMWVEGHVSAALHGKAHARKLSKQRASLCAAMIRARLLVLDASLNAAHAEGLVAAVGLGNEKPLPGFDDGGNYAENRRVEFHVQQLLTAVEDGGAVYHVDVYPPAKE